MSSRYVRSQFRSYLTGATLPVYDSINKTVTARDPIWMTYRFNAEYSEKNSYCGDWAELGLIELIFMGKPGTGDDAVLQAAEAEAKRIYASTDPTGALVFESIQPPDELSDGDADAKYRIVIGIEYRYLSKI